MSFVLRRIEKKNWDRDKVYADYHWLEKSKNEIPAECLIDLNAKGNELSLWYVTGPDDTNIKHICAALSVTRNNLSHFEYALFEIERIKKAEFIIHETIGQTPDALIGHLHRDIKQLTASSLLSFLEAVWSKAITGLILKNELDGLIRTNLESGRLNRDKMSSQLRDKYK